MSKGKKHSPPKCPGCKRRRELVHGLSGQFCADCTRKKDRKAA